MPLPAGKYNVQFRWMRQSQGVDPHYGQPLQAWTSAFLCWGYLTGESFSFNEKGSQSRATIHLRGQIPLGDGDKLEEVIRGTTVQGKFVRYSWTITGLQQDAVNNELLVEVFR